MARRRHVGLRWSVGFGVCFFMAGCLFHKASDPDLPFESVERKARTNHDKIESENPIVAGQAENRPADAAPAPLSPYGVRPLQPVTRLSASLDPVVEERVRLELRPALAPEPEKPDPRKPTAPAPVDPPPPVKEAPLVGALRAALEQHPREAKLLLEKYDKSDRDLLLALLRLTANVEKGDLPKLGPDEVERTLEQLSELTLHLRRRAPLTLGKVCFCRSIENFGQYTAVPADYQFQAGCEGRPGERVQIYAEVRNFGSQLRDGQYETILACALDFKHDGQKVVTISKEPCSNRSQSPRQDYFLNFRFNVPQGLPPGLYTLWVTVKDVTPAAPGQPACARVAKRSLDFKVCPPGVNQTLSP